MSERLWVNDERTVLVTQWESGSVTVARRETPAHTWGPPVTCRLEAPASAPELSAPANDHELSLFESYKGTIMVALAHENTPAAVGTLRELERQGWRLPAWVLNRLENEAEREALRREAHDEAMLDAGPILADYRRQKGEL